MRRVLSGVCALVALPAAFGAAWFDAGVGDYQSWPSDGSDVVLTGVGTWSGTEAATLAVGENGSRLAVDTSGSGTLGFGAAVTKAIATDLPSVTTTAVSRQPKRPFRSIRRTRPS